MMIGLPAESMPLTTPTCPPPLRGITAIAPWRDHIQATGLAEAARIIKSNGMKVTGYCRGGLFPAADAAGRASISPAVQEPAGPIVSFAEAIVTRFKGN